MSHINKLVNSIVNYVKKKTLPKIIIFIALNALSPYKLYTFDKCYNERGQGAALIYIDDPLFETGPCSLWRSTRIEIKLIEVSLKKFYRKCGFYPSTKDGLSTLKTKPESVICENYPFEGFVERNHEFIDTWERSLRYELVSGKPNIISAGKDGEFGTPDDISLFEMNKNKTKKVNPNY